MAVRVPSPFEPEIEVDRSCMDLRTSRKMGAFLAGGNLSLVILWRYGHDFSNESFSKGCLKILSHFPGAVLAIAVGTNAMFRRGSPTDASRSRTSRSFRTLLSGSTSSSSLATTASSKIPRNVRNGRSFWIVGSLAAERPRNGCVWLWLSRLSNTPRASTRMALAASTAKL